MNYLHIILIVLMIAVSSCDLFLPEEISDSVKIYPRISFAENFNYSLDSVDVFKAQLIFVDTVRDTVINAEFKFKDGEGELDQIPIKTAFDLEIFGCDIEGTILFQGKIDNLVITDDTTLFIEALMVTPLKPSNFKLEILPNEKIRFSWEDNSRNENKFHLKSARTDNPAKFEIVKEIQKNKKSVEVEKKDHVCSYIIEAFNDAGPSYNPDTIVWYWDDTLNIEKKLILPVKNNSKYEKNKPYFFQIEPAQTESEYCPRGHKVQYRFHFYDDSTGWVDTRAYVYTFNSSGKKRIKFKKRCNINTYAESEWSREDTIEVK